MACPASWVSVRQRFPTWSAGSNMPKGSVVLRGLRRLEYRPGTVPTAYPEI